MTYRDYDETPVDAEFKQKINVEFLVLKQIDRCNQAALEGDEIKFSNATESLLAMLPKENRKRIESDKVKEEYITKIEQPVYKYSCGKPMGTIENPIYRNKKSDWNYDGGEPILISPTVEEVEQTDYQKLYKIVLNELQDVGVTWKIEPRGNVEKKIDPPMTPLLKLKDGKYVRILVEKGVEAIQDGIVKDEVEKPKTTNVGENDARTEPEHDPESEPESDPDNEDGENEGDPDEFGDETGEGKTETGSANEAEDGEEKETENEDEEENEGESISRHDDEYDKLLEDAQDENLEAYKQKQKDKKEQDKILRIKRQQFEENKNIITTNILTIKTQENKDSNKNNIDKDKDDEKEDKELEKYMKKRNKKLKEKESKKMQNMDDKA